MGHLRDIDHPEGHSVDWQSALGHHSVRGRHLFARNRGIELGHFVDPLLMLLPAVQSDASFVSALEGV